MTWNDNASMYDEHLGNYRHELDKNKGYFNALKTLMSELENSKSFDSFKDIEDFITENELFSYKKVGDIFDIKYDYKCGFFNRLPIHASSGSDIYSSTSLSFSNDLGKIENNVAIDYELVNQKYLCFLGRKKYGTFGTQFYIAYTDAFNGNGKFTIRDIPVDLVGQYGLPFDININKMSSFGSEIYILFQDDKKTNLLNILTYNMTLDTFSTQKITVSEITNFYSYINKDNLEVCGYVMSDNIITFCTADYQSYSTSKQKIFQYNISTSTLKEITSSTKMNGELHPMVGDSTKNIYAHIYEQNKWYYNILNIKTGTLTPAPIENKRWLKLNGETYELDSGVIKNINTKASISVPQFNFNSTYNKLRNKWFDPHIFISENKNELIVANKDRILDSVIIHRNICTKINLNLMTKEDIPYGEFYSLIGKRKVLKSNNKEFHAITSTNTVSLLRVK